MKRSLFTVVILLITSICLGQDWVQLLNSPQGNSRFDDIFFVNEDTGWAADGGGSTVYKTTDGGENWVTQFSANAYFRNIEFLNENVGFLGTLNSEFYKTTDGGENWNLVTLNPNPEAICGIEAVGENIVYAVGAYFSPALLYKSIDGGETFTYTDMSAYADGLVEVLFLDENHGFIGGRGYDGGVVLETFDGGDSWTEIFNTGQVGEYVWKLQVRNQIKIFGSVDSPIQGKLIKSFDGGANWEVKSFPDTAVQAVGFISDTKGWMGGHNSGFYETNDGGDTWVDINLGGSLNRFIFLNDDLAYCVGNHIYKYDRTLGVSDSYNTSNTDGLEVIIAPLPIDNQLQIQITFEHDDNLLLELYDMQGKFIKRLTRDRVDSAQSKVYNFDFPYAAGNYLLDIHTNSGRRQKVILKK